MGLVPATPEVFGLVMNVNLSARQLKKPGLAEEVAAVLEETGLKSFELDLEITESVVMENLETTSLALRDLKALGVGLAVDDFGTGYSSLAYLNALSVDELKIDKTFVMGLGDAAYSYARDHRVR